MNILSKLIITYLLIATVPLGFISILSYTNAREVVVSQEERSLGAIADLKIQEISYYFQKLRDEVAIMPEYYNIQYNLPVLTAFYKNQESNEYKTAKKMLDHQLTAWQIYRGDIISVEIGNADGVIMYASNPTHAKADIGTKEMVPRHATTSGIIINPQTHEKEIVAVAPILDQGKNTIGIVVLEASPQQLYDIIQNSSGLGKTGETLVAVRADSGTRGVCVTPLRFDPYAAINRSLLLCQTRNFAVGEALAGKSGVGEDTDYRGKSVLAAWRPLPEKAWGVEVKIDMDEILIPAKHIAEVIFIVGLVSMAFVIMVAWLFGRSISLPLSELTGAAKSIDKGSLDISFSERVSSGPNEITLLGNTFLDMIERLRASYAELEKKVADRTRELTEFASLVSHQLKSPVSTVRWYTEMLLSGDFGRLNEKQKEVITEMNHENMRMNGLINALLNLSRIERGTVTIEPAPTNIPDICDDVLKELQNQIAKKRLAIRKSFEKDGRILDADASLMRIIFQNFLTNAIKYSRDSGKITISGEVADGEVIISVANEGEPIPQEDQPKIYERMFRARNAYKFDKQGYGLGLYM